MSQELETSGEESEGENFAHEFEEAFPNLTATQRMSRLSRRPYHNLSVKRQRVLRKQIKFVMQDYDRVLKTMGLCIGALEVAPIESDEDREALANAKFDFKIRPQGSGAIFDPDAEAPIDTCLYVKDKHSLADRTYVSLRSICHMKVPNVNKIKRRRHDIDEKLCVHENEMGVFYSMRDKLVSRLDAFFDKKYGIMADLDTDKFNDEIIHIKLSADGTNIGRSLKLMNFTFTVINEGCKAKTAKGNYTIGIFEIEDENAQTVRSSMRELIEEIEQLDTVSVRGKKLRLVYYYGGDWKMLANSLGIQNANSKYCCVWCKCPKEDFHRLDLEWSITDTNKGARSHEEQAAIISHPDFKKIVTYGYKSEPIFRDLIPINRYMIDMLHLFLRISDTLFNLLIKDCCLADGFDMAAISKFDVAKYKHMNSFQHFLNEKCNVKFAFYWVPETKKLTWRDLVGPEKLRMFENFNLAEIMPNHEKFSEVEQIWTDFLEIVNLVKDVAIEASELATRTKEWLKLYLSVYNKATVTPYIHAFVAHLHEFVSLYKDINVFNCQGLEKLNDLSTTQYFMSTNRSDFALHQMLKKRNRLEYLSDLVDVQEPEDRRF